jgi:hypothetical protein
MSRDIIPHKKQKVQVSIPENTDENVISYGNNPFLRRNRVGIQAEIYALYDAGLNIFPQPHGSKGGYPWKRLQYSRLARDHHDYGLQTLFAGECNLAVMCGRTSGNLFVIDCESAESLAYHISQIRERRIPLWAVQTARGGHIYLRAADGEVQNIEPGVLPEAEIKGCNGYVLAPPSVHPSGVVYQWLAREGDEPPTVNSQKIDWLMDPKQKRIALQTTAVTAAKKGGWKQPVISPLSNLSRQTREFIQQGHSISQGERNNRLFKAACDLCGNHYPLDEAHALLAPSAIMCGLPTLEIDRTIQSAYSRKRNPARPAAAISENRSVQRSWYHALLWVTRHNWKKSTGTSERSLALALIERARVSMNETGIFRASIRELAQLARLGTTTVQRTLTRLQDYFIVSCGYDSGSQAALWSFQKEVLLSGQRAELNLNTVALPPHWIRYSESLFNSDLVERMALGHGAVFVYQFLLTLDAPMMPSEIAESLGVTLNQVNYSLRKLKLHALVVRHPTGWYPAGVTLAQMEESFAAAAGAGERRARRFQHEREVFAGRILFNARLRSEQRSFLRSVQRVLESQQAMRDPLWLLALELGGVCTLSDGTVLTVDDLLN